MSETVKRAVYHFLRAFPWKQTKRNLRMTRRFIHVAYMGPTLWVCGNFSGYSLKVASSSLTVFVCWIQRSDIMKSDYPCEWKPWHTLVYGLHLFSFIIHCHFIVSDNFWICIFVLFCCCKCSFAILSSNWFNLFAYRQQLGLTVYCVWLATPLATLNGGEWNEMAEWRRHRLPAIHIECVINGIVYVYGVWPQPIRTKWHRITVKHIK